jgi:hypothetical protein
MMTQQPNEIYDWTLDTHQSLASSSDNTTTSTTLNGVELAHIVIILPLRSILIVVAILLFVACVLMRNRQPLKSRSILPFLVVLMSIASSIGIMQDSIPEYKIIKGLTNLFAYRVTWCYIRCIALYPTFIITMASYTLAIARYFVMKLIIQKRQDIAAAVRLNNKEVADDLTEFDIDETEMDELTDHSEMVMNTASSSNRLSTRMQSSNKLTADMLSESAIPSVTSDPTSNTTTSSIGAGSTAFLTFLEFCISKKAIVVILIVLMVLWYICFIVILVLFKGNCPASIDTQTLFVLIFGVITVIALPITAIVDLILNYRLIIRFQIIQYLIHSDPLLFRLEMWLLVVVGITALTIELVVTNVLIKFGMVIISDFSRSLIRTLLFDVPLCFIIVPGIALSTSIRNRLLERRQHNFVQLEQQQPQKTIVNLKEYNPSEPTIRLLLKSKITCELFRAYLKKEWSLENLLFLEDVYRYKQIKKQRQKYKKAQTIVDLYLFSTSKLEVNVPQTDSNKVKSILKENENSKQLSDDLFKDLQETVVKNLIDSYSRFYHSAAFQAHIKTIL